MNDIRRPLAAGAAINDMSRTMQNSAGRQVAANMAANYAEQAVKDKVGNSARELNNSARDAANKSFTGSVKSGINTVVAGANKLDNNNKTNPNSLVNSRIEETIPLPPMISKGPTFSNGNFQPNKDPTLGGENWNPPACQGPGSYFNFYCKNTPATTPSTKIIPWDHHAKDYVYSAVSEEDLRGAISRRELKKRMDVFKKSSVWDSVSCYNLIIPVFIVLLVLVLVVIIVFLIVSPSRAGNIWYVLVAVPIILVIIAIITVVACRNQSNESTFRRKALIDDELAFISKGAPVRIRSGEASSYLEVHSGGGALPEQATNINAISQAPMASSLNVSRTPEKLNLMDGDNINDVSTIKLNGREVPIDQVPEYRPMGISQELPEISSNSANKRSFQERLANKSRVNSARGGVDNNPNNDSAI